MIKKVNKVKKGNEKIKCRNYESKISTIKTINLLIKKILSGLKIGCLTLLIILIISCGKNCNFSEQKNEKQQKSKTEKSNFFFQQFQPLKSKR